MREEAAHEEERGRSKPKIKLVAFDLDGTLTRERTCLEAIAAAYGFAHQISALERARTEDELSAARLDVWAYLEQLSDEDMNAVLMDIPLAPGAIEGIAALHAAGITTVIVSLALASNVAFFGRLLGVETHFGTESDGRGGFRHVFPATKPELVSEHAQTLGLSPEQIAVVGDSLGDLPMLRAFRTSVYVGPELPSDFTPTWHLPAAPIDEIARVILQLNEESGSTM